MRVKAFLFDVFGTTVDWQNCVHRQLQAKCSQQQLCPASISSEQLLDFTITWRIDYMSKIKDAADRGDSDADILVLIRQSLDQLLQRPEWKALSSWSSEDRHESCQFWGKLDGWSDVSQLDKVKSKAIIGALSNGSLRIMLDIAKHAGLPWDMIFSCEMIGAFKPNPRAYQRPMEWLRLKPDEVAMVAAHIYDLRAAAQQGMKTIYIPRSKEDIRDKSLPGGPESVKSKSEGGEVDAVIHCFEELVKYC